MKHLIKALILFIIGIVIMLIAAYLYDITSGFLRITIFRLSALLSALCLISGFVQLSMNYFNFK